MRIRARRLLADDAVRDDAVLVVEAERIAAIDAGGPADVDLDGWLVPGFVDTHVHGGGGVDLTDPDPTPALTLHRRHGSTTIVASTVTAELPVLQEQLGRLAALCEAGELAGIHLEGPCLADARRGAHDPTLLRAPTPELVDELLAAGRGHVRMMTLAPELPGGLAAIARLREAGAVAAFGHSDADAAACREAVQAGATVATHLFNAMRPIHHRDPGPVPVLLTDPRVVVELVCDGVHLAPEVVGLAVATAGPDRVSLVTDAMAAAGMPDGDYALGTLLATVTDGVARVRGGEGPGPIAGSTLTMDRAVAFLVRDVGVPLPQACRMAATTPARALGLVDVGVLRPGALADACVLTDDATLLGVLRHGRWVTQPAPRP